MSEPTSEEVEQVHREAELEAIRRMRERERRLTYIV